MKAAFNFIKQSRRVFITLLDELSLEQLNEVPDGFNNNIIWNFGHIVVSTQILCYLRTGVNTNPESIKYMEAYAKGTKPTYAVSQVEVDELKALAISHIEQLEKDYDAGLFNQINTFDTHTYKVAMSTIEEIIQMTIGHDNLHLGYALAQKKIIQSTN